MLTSDHSYLHYGKGAVAMYALQDYIGEERVNRALRRLVDRFRYTGSAYPTSLDLYEELRKVTPASRHGLLDDLVTRIVLWDLQTKAAHAERTSSGEYRVTIEIEGRKLESEPDGTEREIPMDDFVDIGIFGPATGRDEAGQPLYLKKHRIRSGTQTITVTVPAKPSRAGIDPYHKLIARHPDAIYRLDLKIPRVSFEIPERKDRSESCSGKLLRNCSVSTNR